MRSGRRSGGGQESLPFDLAPAQPDATVKARRATAAPPVHPGRYRLSNDALTSHGWPSGTELIVEADRRPRRGEVALAREGDRLKIGIFDVQFGRGVLRTDRGVAWLGASARFVGVVTVAGAPFDGMPDPAPKVSGG